MDNSSTLLTKRDIPVLIGTILMTAVLAGLFTGFIWIGFQYPYSYSGGGDDYSILSQAKQLAEEKWLWSTDRLGAPFGQNMLDYPSILLQNSEYLMLKFWSFWSKDPVVMVNLQFLFTFILCAAAAYLALRKLGIRSSLSFCGAMLFAFAPYIYGRGIGHYCLTACYFVPASVYLCFLAYGREDFLNAGTLFRDKRENLIILLLCFLIAGNGIGYYPFFTCFLLCVTAGCRFFESRDVRKAVPALKLVLIITVMMVLILTPAFLFNAANGKNDITSRNLAGVETYGLKITQFFIPMFHHNIGILKSVIGKYNTYMPLVNENTTSYLGVIAGIGFVIQMLSFFGLKFGDREKNNVEFGAKLSLASVLFMSVGGFISLITTVLGIASLRGFNRISIYVMFISIAVLCFLGESMLEKLKGSNGKKVLLAAVFALTVFGVWEQSPDISTRAASLENSGIRWVKDEIYIEKIEASLQPGDMVFQLPYLPYPEGGNRERLQRYRHLNAYLHSDTLKWSFGVMKGRPGDQWYQSVAAMDGEQMVKTLIETGFKGLYIDRSGYTDEEFLKLHEQLKGIPGMKQMVDPDKILVFYSFYPVIEENPEFQAAKQ